MLGRFHPPLSRRVAPRRFLGAWAGLAMLVGAAASVDATTTESTAPSVDSATVEALTFERQVRPILKAHCFDCHGEGEKPAGGLDLRLARFMLRGGDSGPALSPGRPDESRLFSLVQSGEMPKRSRKPTAAEIEILRRWIESGARTLRTEPESLPQGMAITAEEKSHWSFQPLRRPAVPRPDPRGRGRNPIDAFVAAPFATHGLAFSPDAPARTLIRRLYLDLWGIPPTPAEIAEFESDPRPDAYEQRVERLLASPRYGERWGRHWLDIAGYADSDGYTNDDNPRPYAYRYRDYVIRSFNEDKPWDRFVLEQLAGDELALERHQTLEAAAQDPETREWLVATGFLRMAADGTASSGVDQETARNQVMADTLKIVSTSLLGLSVGCAQCHDHRYDPIPQTDYYRLRAIFEPAYDWKAWRTPAQRLVSLYTPADRDAAARIEAEAARIAREKEAKQSQYLDDALKKHLETFDPALREALWTAFKTPTDRRTAEQKKLLRDHPSANITPGVLYQYNPKAADDLKAMDARIAAVRARKPVEDFLPILTEPAGHRPPTHRFHRGDPKQPREIVPPGTLTVLEANAEGPGPAPTWTREGSGTSGRRRAFAEWVASPRNPLFPRVLVNRIWMHHFGRGLVGTPSDFGLQGEPPSHPELLDWLAATFAAPASSDPGQPGLGWSLKGLHRLILLSTTYRQSSARNPDHEAVDPENRFYWRRPVLRLEAEALRDSYLAVSGTLSGRTYGPPVPVREDAVGQVVVGIDKKEGDNKMPVDVPLGEDEFRRSVYVEVRRSRPLAFLNVFDAPVMETNCERRPSSTVAPQSLMLMNSAFALQQAGLFAERLRAEAKESREAQIELAWRWAYGRPPTASERDAGLAFLALQQRTLETAAATTNPASRPAEARWKDVGPRAATTSDPALQSLCQALLSSNEFLYLD